MKKTYDLDSLYNLKEELQKEKGMLEDINLIQLKCLFTEYQIIEFSEIEEYIKQNKSKIYESKYSNYDEKNIIASRKKDYQYLFKTVKTLSEKGLELLEVIDYLKNGDEFEDKEQILLKMQINHYKQILSGYDIIRLISVLAKIKKEFIKNLGKINNVETYHLEIIDNFTLKYATNLYPTKFLYQPEKDKILDKTSIAPKTKRRILFG